MNNVRNSRILTPLVCPSGHSVQTTNEEFSMSFGTSKPCVFNAYKRLSLPVNA